MFDTGGSKRWSIQLMQEEDLMDMRETTERRNRRKLSSVMAMILGAYVTIEIMIMGAMLLKVDFHSADRIALALGFMVLYSGVVAALTDK